MKRLMEGLSVMLTGAAKGIGAACAKAAAEHGASYIMIVDMDIENGTSTAKAIQKEYGVRCSAMSADVSDENSVKSVFASFLKDCDHLDVLLNCAGICRAISMDEISVNSWDLTMAVNVKGAFLFTREALKLMRPRRFGKIINMSSQAGKSGGITAGMDYSVSKGGLLTLTKSTAKAVAEDNINVNTIAPGLIVTAMTNTTFHYDPQTVPLKRLGTPQDIANAFVFLSSELSSYITGACIDVNGGILMD